MDIGLHGIETNAVQSNSAGEAIQAISVRTMKSAKFTLIAYTSVELGSNLCDGC